jgi:phage gp36-like protein
MKNKYRNLALLVIAGSAFTFPAYAAQDAMSKAEARQTVEDTSPRAQYNRSTKEAQAAYQEALAGCGKMRGAEKTACTKEAKTNLQNDLAYARKVMNGDISVGSSEPIRETVSSSSAGSDAGSINSSSPSVGSYPAPGSSDTNSGGRGSTSGSSDLTTGSGSSAK